MQEINSANAPQPAGHYSQAIMHQGIVYVSGQLPINPLTKEKIQGTIEEQAEQAFENLFEVLKASGSGPEHVLKTTVYISNIDLWPKVNAIYAHYFGSHRPARSIIPTRTLHYGFLIEVDAIAAVKTIE